MPRAIEAGIRHAGYYHQVISEADDLYQCGGEAARQGLELFTVELENIRAGQARAETRSALLDGFAELCRDYPMHGANFLNLRFHPKEQISWCEAGLAAARRLKDRAAEGALLSNLGMALDDIGESQRSLECQQEALKITREIGDRYGEEQTLGNLGASYQALNQHESAIECYENQSKIAEEVGDGRGAANALMNVGISRQYMGQIKLALDLF